MTGQASYWLTTEGDLGERKTACVDPNIVRANDGTTINYTVLADAPVFIIKSRCQEIFILGARAKITMHLS